MNDVFGFYFYKYKLIVAKQLYGLLEDLRKHP